MSALSLSQLRTLPKVDLHRHLDCSMRWSTLVELAPKVGISLPPSPQARRDEFLVTSPMKDLDSVLRKFLHAQKALASEEILERLAFEACEDAFNDGILVVELRYAPTFIADGHSHLTFEKIHQALHKGISRAQKTFPMVAGLIGIIQRIRPVKEAEAVMDFMIDHKSSFIGVDLADNEDGFDPKPFAPLFQKAKKAGIHVTIHSGETPSPDAPRWIRDSIELLGAERIGHGIQAIRDPAVMKILKDRDIPLEICPISNGLTNAFPSDKDHSIRPLWDAGVCVTINSDDPGVFASTLTDDYEWLQRVHGFTAAEFARANENSIRHSFLPLSEIERVWPAASRKGSV